MEVVRFYRARDAWGEFSNFAPYPICIEGRTWPTTEHYFQAQKFAGTPHEEAVRNAPTPGAAARIGQDRNRPLREDWEEVKDDVMRTAVFAKFSQHRNLRELLISTAEAKLVEHTHRDSYWGDGGDGSGLNMLGQILMAVRATLASSSERD